MNIFVRAVEHTSFVAAARSLLLDPAAVSRAVSSLEKDLGTLLFARSTRVLKLTPDGARFYRDCVQILKKVKDATQRMRADEETPVGPLRIGMAPGLRRRILLRVMPEFQNEYPRIAVTLVSVDERAEFGAKGVDVLIRARSVRQHGAARPEPQGLIVRRLFQSRYVVCAAPGYLKRAGMPRVPLDLLQHRCLVHVNLEHDVAHEWRFAKADARQTVKLTPSLRVQGVDALCEAGVAGGGIVRFLAASIEEELEDGKLVPVLVDWECTGVPPMQAIYRKTKPMNPQVSAFVRHVVEVFRRYER